MKPVAFSRLHRDRFTLLLAALGILGAIIILLRVHHGIGVSGDAKYYIELARAFAEGGRGLDWLLGQAPHLVWNDYSRWAGPSYLSLKLSAIWPPLYPMMLAASGGFVFDARDVAGPFNAVAFGLTVFVAGQWMRLHVSSKPLVALGCAAIVFSVTVSYWASWAFSETAFILLATLALYFIERFFISGNRSFLIWAAIFTALACMTRYPGVVLVLIIVPLIYLRSEADLTERLKRIGLYVAIGVTPLALYLLRNYLVLGALTSHSENLKYGGPVKQFGRGLSSIEAWNPLIVDIRAILLPVDFYTGRIIGAGFAGVVLIAFATITLWGLVRWINEGVPDTKSKLSCLTVAGSFAFGHLAFMIAIFLLSTYFHIDSRQIIPAYVPLVVAITIAVDTIWNNRGKPFVLGPLTNLPVVRSLNPARTLPAAVVVAFALCVIYAGFVSIRDTHKAVFEPEVGWNAYVYNGDRIDIQTTSLTEYLKSLVGDAQPVVRDHFDLYLADGSLIYFKDGCDEEDMEEGVRLRVEPASKLVLSGIRKNFGIDILDFYPVRQGAILDGKCLMLAPLPKYRIANISTGQYHNDAVELWAASFVINP